MPILNVIEGQWVAGDRPQASGHVHLNWERSPGATKHHMIPWSTWARLIAYVFNTQGSNRKTLWDLILSIVWSAETLGAIGSVANQAFNSIKHQTVPTGEWEYIGEHLTGVIRTERKNNGHFNAANMLTSVVHDLCWMPGNLFIGKPSEIRTDDPGDTDFDYPPYRLYTANEAQVRAFYQCYLYLKKQTWTFDKVVGSLGLIAAVKPREVARVMVTMEAGMDNDWVDVGNGRFKVYRGDTTKLSMSSVNAL